MNPGPGRYEFEDQMNKTGKYFSSRYKSSGSKVWNPPSSQRFNKSSNLVFYEGTPVPAANSYFPINDMSDSGKYVLSSTKGAGRRRFEKEFRSSFVDGPAKITRTPGPGTYRQPSEFGQYDHQLTTSLSQL
jgi:hypothetical protein